MRVWGKNQCFWQSGNTRFSKLVSDVRPHAYGGYGRLIEMWILCQSSCITFLTFNVVLGGSIPWPKSRWEFFCPLGPLWLGSHQTARIPGAAPAPAWPKFRMKGIFSFPFANQHFTSMQCLPWKPTFWFRSPLLLCFDQWSSDQLHEESLFPLCRDRKQCKVDTCIPPQLWLAKQKEDEIKHSWDSSK